MENAKIDQNFKPTMIGVSYLDGVSPVLCAVDPITGYLLIDVVDTTFNASPVLRSNAQIDANGKETMLGWNGTNTQAMITHNGYLGVQFN
jgi:hypothetical protein